MNEVSLFHSKELVCTIVNSRDVDHRGNFSFAKIIDVPVDSQNFNLLVSRVTALPTGTLRELCI